jgi:transcription elongation factor GreA
MSDLIPMTRTGYEKIKAEVDHLEQVEMPAITKRIALARSEGDLSENAEYHGARESQGMLQAKINLLRDKLARASLVDPSKLPKGEVVFGSTVVRIWTSAMRKNSYSLALAKRTTTPARSWSPARWPKA